MRVSKDEYQRSKHSTVGMSAVPDEAGAIRPFRAQDRRAFQEARIVGEQGAAFGDRHRHARGCGQAAVSSCS